MEAMKQVVGSVKAEDNGDGVKIYTLERGSISARLSEFGATLLSLTIPDIRGNVDDIVLGFDSLTPYMDGTSPYFGATVGRVANRIAGASFSLNGKVYSTMANEGNNTLHGGYCGFDKVKWHSKVVDDCRGPSVQFTYNSFDGEQGFPGDLEVSTTYTLSADFDLQVEMVAKPKNMPTPVNLAHHSYWNLAGHDSGDILNHRMAIQSLYYTPVDEHLVPTGEICPVGGTPFDFLEETTIGSRINEVPGGYDHNYVLRHEDSPTEGLHKLVRLSDPSSGRVMTVSTDAPGLQFYSGNQIQEVKGKGGSVYGKHAGLCLETQGFPNAVNETKFPSIIVHPGETYKHTVVFSFSVSA